MPNKSCFTFIEVKYTLVGYHYFCIFNLEKVKQNKTINTKNEKKTETENYSYFTTVVQ